MIAYFFSSDFGFMFENSRYEINHKQAQFSGNMYQIFLECIHFTNFVSSNLKLHNLYR